MLISVWMSVLPSRGGESEHRARAFYLWMCGGEKAFVWSRLSFCKPAAFHRGFSHSEAVVLNKNRTDLWWAVFLSDTRAHFGQPVLTRSVVVAAQVWVKISSARSGAWRFASSEEHQISAELGRAGLKKGVSGESRLTPRRKGLSAPWRGGGLL